jgi:hypothetical protein
VATWSSASSEPQIPESPNDHIGFAALRWHETVPQCQNPSVCRECLCANPTPKGGDCILEIVVITERTQRLCVFQHIKVTGLTGTSMRPRRGLANVFIHVNIFTTNVLKQVSPHIDRRQFNVSLDARERFTICQHSTQVDCSDSALANNYVHGQFSLGSQRPLPATSTCLQPVSRSHRPVWS